MASLQHGNGLKKKQNSSASGTGMSDASTKQPASMPLGASVSSSKTTTATTPKGLQKTWTSAELEVLRSKIGLVAGALADFKSAKGLVVVRQKEYNGQRFLSILLVAEGLHLEKVRTDDGLDFEISLVAEKKSE